MRSFFIRGICLLLMCCGADSLFAQQIRVLSAADSTPVAAAHLLFKKAGSNRSLILLSDDRGKAIIPEDMQQFPVTLQLSCLGFQTITDTLSDAVDLIYYLRAESVSINEVVITGQYAPGNTADAVQVVNVISRKKIDMMAAQNLRDVLSNELNIRLSQDNVLGGSMSLQGISGQNVKILVDGVPVIGRLNGNIDISQINLDNVERVEVVEGPLSVNYGTDALAGTINIIMKKDQAKTFSISNSDFYESNGQYNISGKLGYQKNKNTVQLTVGRNYFDGWNEGDRDFRYDRTLLADSNRVQSWKPKEQYFGSLFYARKMKALTLGFTSEIFDEQIINRGLPRAPYGESAFDDTYKTFRVSNTLDLSGKLNDRYRINMIAGYNYFRRTKNTFYKDLTSLSEQLTSSSEDQDTSVFKAMMSRGTIASTRTNAAFNFEIGYDINQETASGYQIEDRRQAIGDFAVFSTAEYIPVRGLVIRPGLRAAYNTQYKAPLVPSLNLKYEIPLGKEKYEQSFVFRASYARGFRAPSLKELYFDFVDINHDIHGNRELQAEYSDNFIVNANWQKLKNQSVFKVAWNSFYNTIRNRITLAQTAPAAATYTYANLGHFRTFGSSVNGELAFYHWKLSVGGGWIALYNELSETNAATDKFSLTPEARASLLYEWKQQQVSFALVYKYTGKTPGYILDMDGNVQQNILQDYHTADISVAKAFMAERFRLSAGSRNLFNVTRLAGNGGGGSPHSMGSSSIPYSTGRTWFLKLDLNLNYD